MNLKFFVICQAVLIYHKCLSSLSIDEIHRKILQRLDSEPEWKDGRTNYPKFLEVN